MIGKISIPAAHETGHLIMYLLKCCHTITGPCVNEIALTHTWKGHISTRPDTSPELLSDYLNSDIPDKHKAWYIAAARWEIKYILSGTAAEIIAMGLIEDLPRLLLRFYKLQKKDPTSDLPQAIVYNDIIEGRSAGIDALAPLLSECITNLLPYKDLIIEIGLLLDKERKLTGDQLQPFIDKFMNECKPVPLL